MMSERWKARLNQIGAAVQAGIEPEIAAARTLDAIRRKQFYIFTHPESRAKIEGRIQTISIRCSYLNDTATLRLLRTCPEVPDAVRVRGATEIPCGERPAGRLQVGLPTVPELRP